MDANKLDPIPAQFKTLEEAGEFWDTHSAADYWDDMEEVDVKFLVEERMFMVPIAEQLYHLLKQRAQQEQRSINDVIQSLLLQNTNSSATPISSS